MESRQDLMYNLLMKTSRLTDDPAATKLIHAITNSLYKYKLMIEDAQPKETGSCLYTQACIMKETVEDVQKYWLEKQDNQIVESCFLMLSLFAGHLAQIVTPPELRECRPDQDGKFTSLNDL